MQQRPNIILILVDDMGFADIGITGSEIKTPNLDGLANNGVLLTAMYNCARCCPTRASLLTGLYPHNAGIGHMGINLGTEAYQGYLRNDSVTIAEVLRAGGYRTLMSGKWHVAGDFDPRDMDSWRVGDVDHPTPRQRGFDRFYGTLDGATHFFSPHYMLEDDGKIEVAADEFYYTDAITDKAISMMQDSVADSQPFFSLPGTYRAALAPARFSGRHCQIRRHLSTWMGHNSNSASRGNEQQDLFQANWDISPRDNEVQPWKDIKLKDWEASKMATYAAMVDRMDQSIGRVIKSLKDMEQFDNTLILFLSDNGGCAEFMAEDGWAQGYPDKTLDGRQITMGNIENLRPGDAQTFQSYDKPWANVSNAPFKKFKHYVHEGGISTPLIAHWPVQLKQNHVAHQACHVVDILPTILEASGCSYLTELDGHEIQPMQGESFIATTETKKLAAGTADILGTRGQLRNPP